MSHPDLPLLRRPEEIANRPAWARDLYLARIEAGLTLSRLADLTGIHLTTLSTYENGRERPSALQEQRIRQAFER
jgi:transcriptional regulator with XRE-family HTH domain